MKLWTRALMILALLGLAGAAQARPSVSVGGGGCDATVALGNAVNAVAAADADATAALPRLSQLVGHRVRIPAVTGGFCLPVVNDVGILRSLTFDTNIELATLDVLPGSTLARVRVNESLKRATTYDGQIQSRLMYIRIVGTSRSRVYMTLRRFRADPVAGSH